MEKIEIARRQSCVEVATFLPSAARGQASWHEKSFVTYVATRYFPQKLSPTPRNSLPFLGKRNSLSLIAPVDSSRSNRASVSVSRSLSVLVEATMVGLGLVGTRRSSADEAAVRLLIVFSV